MGRDWMLFPLRFLEYGKGKDVLLCHSYSTIQQCTIRDKQCLLETNLSAIR